MILVNSSLGHHRQVNPIKEKASRMENKDVRKLSLYSRDGQFNTSVEGAALSAFIHMIDLNVHKRKDINELKQKPEARHFTIDEYQCVLTRESTLREYATLVGGLVPILKFFYATEIVEYEWYPQNPLERAKLDQFFDWYYAHRTSEGLIKKADLAIVE